MLYSWIYVFINSLSSVLRRISGNQLSPAWTLFIGCCVAVIYFHLVNITKLHVIYKECYQHKKEWLYMSISVAIIWICAIYSPANISASLYTFLFFSVLGILGSFFLYLKKEITTRLNLISIFCLFGLIFFMITLVLIKDCSFKQILGITLACMGGVAGFVYGKQSSHFIKITSLSASQVLAIRFYLTIFISILLLPPHSDSSLTYGNMMLAVLVGIVCLIAPLYFSQKGIEKAGPELNAIFVSSTPVVTSLVEEIYFRDVHRSMFIVCILYSFFVLVPTLMRKFQKA